MIRKYLDTDLEEVIHLLHLNTPKYFHESEEQELRNYLSNELDDYFVVELVGKIIASGGINYKVDSQKSARISWDMVAPKMQGKGIGKELLTFRIQYIKNKGCYSVIIVRTSKLAYRFYERFGFVLKVVEKGFWAKDLDLYLMKINLK